MLSTNNFAKEDARCVSNATCNAAVQGTRANASAMVKLKKLRVRFLAALAFPSELLYRLPA